MPTKTGKPYRFELNAAALTETQRAVAMGLQSFGEEIAHVASRIVTVGSDPRYGHVRDQWGVVSFFQGKKVGQASADGSTVQKPRDFRPGKETAAAVVGFGFPGRFLETGTSDTRPQPFLSPAAQTVSGNAAEIIREGAAPYWPRKG